MSTEKILVLGAIAGFTIFLGLPLGRVTSLDPRFRASLSALATGILVFLLWDVLSGAVEPVEHRLEEHSWGPFAGYAALLGGGFAIGLMSLVYYDQWMGRRRTSKLVGPGAAAVDEFRGRGFLESLTPARRLALLIATGIGLHNFGEGLAIGQSAAAGEIALAVTLIVGFGLHNATEGFGIVGPLSADADRPSWRFLGVMGLIGGGPTFVGTIVGQAWVSEALSVAFFALAGGSILYVVIQLVHVNRKFDFPVLVMWMLFAGLALGFATDFVIDAAGV
jgi:zinc transporter, ZIP family